LQLAGQHVEQFILAAPRCVELERESLLADQQLIPSPLGLAHVGQVADRLDETTTGIAMQRGNDAVTLEDPAVLALVGPLAFDSTAFDGAAQRLLRNAADALVG